MTASAVFPYQRPSLNGLRVLVVDNNRDCVELIKTILEEFSILVKIATSVKEALDLLKRQKADILISELAMPGEDGYSLIHKVRLCSNLEHIKAIAMTAYTAESGCNRALASGFQAYTEKPFDLDELVTTVAHLAKK